MDRKYEEAWRKLMESMTDEQREEALNLETVEEFLEYASSEKIPLPDELLEAVAGGKNYWRASTGFGKGLTASATGSHNGPDGDGSGFFGLPRW